MNLNSRELNHPIKTFCYFLRHPNVFLLEDKTKKRNVAVGPSRRFISVLGTDLTNCES